MLAGLFLSARPRQSRELTSRIVRISGTGLDGVDIWSFVAGICLVRGSGGLLQEQDISRTFSMRNMRLCDNLIIRK